jgi:outer membrane protein OmpA-like peptidoglycan-associated protein
MNAPEDAPRRLVLAMALAATGALLAGCLLPAPAPYMTGDLGELRQRFAGTPVTVVGRGDAVILRMPADVTFATNSTDIAPSFTPVLTTMADVITEHPEAKVQVTGHADSVGGETYNQLLSQRRANSVAAYLVQLGIDAGRLNIAGEGENAPIAPNDTEAGRALNRRVEVALTRIHLAPALPEPTR